jgi:hypothetical protein
MVLDPLGAQVVRRPGLLSGWGGEDVLLGLLAIFSNFTCILLYCAISGWGGEGVSLETANIVFNKAVRKVIKDTVKHARLVSTTLYYSQVL